MKKFWILALYVFVMIGVSCSFEEPQLKSDVGISYPVSSNPLLVLSTYTLSYKLGYSNSPYRFSDIDPDSSGIQDRVIINFSAPFTVEDGGVIVSAVRGRDSGNIEIEYVVDNYKKQLRIFLDDIKDSTTYEVKLLASCIKDLSGNALDGNNNGMPDSVYDDFVFYVKGPFPNAGIPDNTPISILSWYFSDYVNGDALSDDTIFIRFNRDIDVSTVQDNYALYSYPDGLDYSQNITSWDSISSYELYFVYNDLPDGNAYVFVVKDGIRDIDGRGFDGNGNGILEINDTATLFFKVAIGDSVSVVYPRVNTVFVDDDRIIIEFTKPMELQSINDSTVIVFDVNNNRVLTRLGLYPDKFHLSVEPMLPITDGKIFLSRNLMDTMGLKFDGNGNGYGGEPGTDDVELNF